MIEAFTARRLATEILAGLERRRPSLLDDETSVRAAMEAALLPVRREYASRELPAVYLTALEQELLASIPTRWLDSARQFTADERRHFGIWRGGDVIARLSFLAVGGLVGAFIVWAPFIPIWEKWLPIPLAIAAWYLPDLQASWHRRRYARRLGEIVLSLETAQAQLDRRLTHEVSFDD